MSVSAIVFNALMQILEAKQPIPARALVEAMQQAGHGQVESKRAIQLAFERGKIRLDEQMRVVMVESHLAAA